MSWLWSWWTPPVVPPEPTPAQLTDPQVNALHAEWLRVREQNRADQDAVEAKLVGENNNLRHKLETTERELKDVRAGRKEDEAELRVIRAELQSLTADKSDLRVAVLDLEEDFFSPRILYSTNPANAMFDAVSRIMTKALGSDSAAPSSTCFIFVFWRSNEHFALRCIASGLFESVRHFDAFLKHLSQAHPLLSLQVFDGSVDLVRQRQSAYAIAFARAVSCKCLLLGRWALDLRFLESIYPPPGQTDRSTSNKILVIEPVVGQYVPPQIRRCGVRFIRMPGVIRGHPLQGGDSASAAPQLNFNKPLWQQNPPLCLDFYLDGKRCLDEACCFSHGYRLHPDVTESLRYEVSRQPCPLLAAGRSCPEGAACHFAHVCPRDPFCSQSGCRFPAWMHTQLKQVVPPAPKHARPSAAGGAQVAPPHSPANRVFSPSPDHSIQPSSPFGHPLSAASESRPGTASNLNMGHLSDAELVNKLAKARQEELEYERGLAQDPFAADDARGRSPAGMDGHLMPSYA